MNKVKLQQFINDPRFCSETEKYAVAIATGNLSIIPWINNLRDAWQSLDDDQKQVVIDYRKEAGLPPMFFETK